MSPIKRALLYVMSAFYIFAGFNHLWHPDMYLTIVPPGIGEPQWINLMSGLAEIVLGVFLLEPTVRIYAAWGIIALLVAVFPANLYMATENIGAGGTGTGNALLNWVRLPLQAVLILWAWWYTRSDRPRRDPDLGPAS